MMAYRCYIISINGTEIVTEASWLNPMNHVIEPLMPWITKAYPPLCYVLMLQPSRATLYLIHFFSFFLCSCPDCIDSQSGRPLDQLCVLLQIQVTSITGTVQYISLSNHSQQINANNVSNKPKICYQAWVKEYCNYFNKTIHNVIQAPRLNERNVELCMGVDLQRHSIPWQYYFIIIWWNCTV